MSEHDSLDRLATCSHSRFLLLAAVFPKTLCLIVLLFLCAASPQAFPMMARQYNKASSSDYVANGYALLSIFLVASECNGLTLIRLYFSCRAAHAFKPKDFTPRAYSAVSNTNSESPEEIKEKINRLSQTLANTV